MIRRFAKNVFERGLARYAAAGAYYATLSLFPALVCLSAIAAGTGAEAALERLFPAGAMEEYSAYVRGNLTPAMLAAAAALLLGFTAAGIRSAACFATGESGGVKRYLLSFALAPAAAALFILLVLLAAFGESALEGLGCGAGARAAGAAGALALLAGVFALLFRGKRRLAAAGAASAGICAAGAVSSRIIRASVNYSLVYGSAFSVIALMLCFFVCFEILLLCAAFSAYEP